MRGSLISATINNPDDYRYSVDVKGIIMKEFGNLCRVHVIEMNGKSTDRTIVMHISHLRYLSR